uniref:VIgL family C1q-related protein 11 isoform 1 n=1 Tax=Littorina littorea TaxID=31216 RepID=A0A411DEL6_LITLI|nr:VIgL family C1q-related protein 11 isoform 1 [Littorina littorea]
MATSWYTLLLLLSVVSECNSIQWSSSALKEDAAVYTCDNSDLTLSWDVSKTTGETIVDVQWFYEGRSQEIIAFLSHGRLVVLPAFSGRVELTANAGLVIHHVTSGEKGNYSVDVNAFDKSGQFVTLRRMASVLIGENLMLHASQMAVAVFSNSTQRWHVALACATFTYPHTPPFTVEWTTPSGQSVSSSQYKEGQFLLLLDNPVSGGSYTCHVPHSSASVACLHGNNADTGSTVVVDDVKSRLTLLEAENQQLKRHLIEANAKIDAVENKTTNRIDTVENITNNRMGNVENQTKNLSLQLTQHLHDEKTKRVSFHATNLKNVKPSPNEVLIPITVLNNQGNGYNSSTGKFTAPYTGTYCFTATMWGYGPSHYIQVNLMVDGKEELFVDTHFGITGDYDAASLQAVVSVRAGQSVWLQVNGDSNQFYSHARSNSFSGFLISYAL